ncbi:MAG: hypothetical protein QXE13_04445 [Sulfolobales archaeon]
MVLRSLREILYRSIVAWIMIVVLLSITSPSLLILSTAQSQSSQNETVYQNNLAKAEVLRVLLSSVLSMNISSDLREEITKLLSINISTLTPEDLAIWVSNASKTLSSVEEYIREGRAYAVGLVLQRYQKGLANVLENRLREMNLSEEIVRSYVENISSAKNLSDLMRTLVNISIDIEIVNIRNFTNRVIMIGVSELKKGSIERVVDLDNKSSKVLDVLNRVLKRLESLNVSGKAIESIQENIMRIETMRNITSDILKAVASGRSYEESLNESISNISERLYIELQDLVGEINVLMDIAREYNLTDLQKILEDLNNTVSRLIDTLMNISSSREILLIIDSIAVIKLKIIAINESIHTSLDIMIKKPKIEVDIDRLYNKTLSEVQNLTSRSRELIGKILEISKNITCTTPVQPQICAIVSRIPIITSYAEERINEVQNLINTAQDLYSSGKKVEALSILLRAKASASSVYMQLETIYEILLHLIESGKSKSSQPSPPTPSPPHK